MPLSDGCLRDSIRNCVCFVCMVECKERGRGGWGHLYLGWTTALRPLGLVFPLSTSAAAFSFSAKIRLERCLVNAARSTVLFDRFERAPNKSQDRDTYANSDCLPSSFNISPMRKGRRKRINLWFLMGYLSPESRGDSLMV